MTAETTGDELRAAADKLRKIAESATPGPWRSHDTHLGQYGHTATVLSGDRTDNSDPRGHLRAWLPTMSQESWDETRNVWADAAFIAAMHPGIGAALADLLEAVSYAPDDGSLDDPGSDVHDACDRTSCASGAAIALARQINAA